MKQIIIILFVITMCACKNSFKQNTRTIPEETTLKNDSVSELPIKVFSFVFDSIQTNAPEQLTPLNESLKSLYEEASAVKNEEYLKRRIDDYKSKRFAESLAKDFDNTDFTKAAQINVSFLTKEQQDTPGDIRVEEWYFKDENTATSCFKSLINYREREIHFKFISWIWVQQKNKIFFIFTTDYMVDSEPMQTIKQHLIDILENKGKYSLIEMD